MIRDDIWGYGAEIDSSGKIYIAQGESIIEIEGKDMNIIRNNLINPNITAVSCFILSNDQKMIYSIAQNRNIENQPDLFMAINTENFQVEADYKLEGGTFNLKPYELPDGSKLYAIGGHHNGNTVIHVIETEGYTIKKTITFDDPEFPGISAGPYYPFAYDSSSHTLFVGATNVVLAIDT